MKTSEYLNLLVAYAIVFVFVILSIVSCADVVGPMGPAGLPGKDGAQGEQGPKGDAGEDGQDFELTPEELFQDGLDGTEYAAACVDGMWNNIQFKGSTINSRIEASLSGQCSDIPVLAIYRNVEYTVNLGAQTMDLAVGNPYLVAYDQGIIDFLNGASVCGFSDWVLGVPKDVNGLGCIDAEFDAHAETVSYSFLGTSIILGDTLYERD